MNLRIIEEQCTGCGRCVASCRLRLLSLDFNGLRKTVIISERERCTHCGMCVESCLVKALDLIE